MCCKCVNNSGMVEWQNGRMAEWQNGRMAEWRNGGMEEWRNGNDGMAEWQNGRMAEWQNGSMAVWQNGRMAEWEWQNVEWQNGGMAEWQNGGMVFYYIPNLSCYIYGTCQQRQQRQWRQQHQWLLNHLDVLKNLIVYVEQGTKTYAMTLEGASYSVKTVSNPYPPQILWTSLWSSGKILLFRMQGHRINVWRLTFHYLQKGWTWLHIPSPITWTKAVHWNQIHFGDITNAKPYWSIGLRNTQPVIVHRVSKRAASVGFFFHSCQLLLYTYMRIEVTTTRMKLYDFVWMDLSPVCIHLWLSQKDPWAASSSMHTINQSQKFSISMKTSKLEMCHKFSTALCTRANQHKMKTAKNSCVLGVRSKKRISTYIEIWNHFDILFVYC